MRKKTLNRKLTLNKTTVTRLDGVSMNDVNGGTGPVTCAMNSAAPRCPDEYPPLTNDFTDVYRCTIAATCMEFGC